MFLIGSFVIAVSRAHDHSFDFQFIHAKVKKSSHTFWICPIKKGGVGRDTKTSLDRFFDPFNCLIKNTVTTNSHIVFFFKPIKMNAESEIFAWGKKIQFSLQQNRIGTEINIFLPQANISLSAFIL